MEAALVQLDKDHPGFRDPEYRRRRNEIAHLAATHRVGEGVRDVAYTEEELGVWQTALEHLAPLHAQYACAPFRRCWGRLGWSGARIPQLREVNALIGPATGFSMEPVGGLVSPRAFLDALEKRVFLSTQYMRHHSAPLYTPEPDVIHELVGHAALLLDPTFTRLNQLFGRAAKKRSDADCEALIRVYWYTLEFGVVRHDAGYHVVGAGLFSSYGELGRLTQGPKLEPLDFERVAQTPFDPTDYQRVLFVGNGLAEFLADLEAWLLRQCA